MNALNMRRKLAGWTVALLLGTLAPTAIRAQNVTAESTGRKVRSKVTPAYPDIARTAHITGTVKIEATISADGRVVATKVMGGSPLLVQAAIDALERWRFEAAPSDSTEVIAFEFAGNS
jgi:TonB family protein